MSMTRKRWLDLPLLADERLIGLPNSLHLPLGHPLDLLHLLCDGGGDGMSHGKGQPPSLASWLAAFTSLRPSALVPFIP